MSEFNKSLSEVYAIFNNLEDDQKSRLPDKVKNFIKTNRDYDYIPKIKKSISLKEQELMPKTRSMLAMYYLLYFCDSKEEKHEVLKRLKNNK